MAGLLTETFAQDSLAKRIGGKAILSEVLTAIGAIKDDVTRVEVLSIVIPFLVGQDLEIAISKARGTARQIKSVEDRAKSFLRLLACLPKSERAGVLDEMQSIVIDIDDPELRACVLGDMSAYLSGDNRKVSLDNALEAASSVRDNSARARALGRIMPLLQGLDRKRCCYLAFRAVEQIDDFYSQAIIRSELIPHLEGLERTVCLRQALVAASAVDDDYSRVVALSDLARNLVNPEREIVLREALSVARKIINPSSSALALSQLAVHLPAAEQESLFREALASVRVSANDYARTWVLRALLPHLSEALTSHALATARTIESRYIYAVTLGAFARYVPIPAQDDCIREAISAAREIRDNDDRARALSRLVSDIFADEPKADWQVKRNQPISEPDNIELSDRLNGDFIVQLQEMWNATDTITETNSINEQKLDRALDSIVNDIGVLEATKSILKRATADQHFQIAVLALPEYQNIFEAIVSAKKEFAARRDIYSLPPLPELSAAQLEAIKDVARRHPWAKRGDDPRGSFEWVRDYYQEWVGKGLLQGHLKVDSPLYEAFAKSAKRTLRMPDWLDVPNEGDAFMRRLADPHKQLMNLFNRQIASMARGPL